MAANFLDIKSLVDLVSAEIATNIHGKTPEQIGNYFGINCDHTDAEKERIALEIE